MKFDGFEFVDHDPVFGVSNRVLFLRTAIATLPEGLPNTTAPLVNPRLKHFTSEKLCTLLQQARTVQLASTKELSSGKISSRFS